MAKIFMRKRTLLIASLTLVVVAALYATFETRIWAAFPSLCPLSSYLPPEAVASKCDYDGFLDFDILFEAKASKSGFESFIENLAQTLDNPRFERSDSYVKIIADHDVLVDVYWAGDILTAYYVKY